MTEIKLSKSNEKISYTFHNIKENNIEIRFDLPRSIPKGLRRDFFYSVKGQFHWKSCSNDHSYLMYEFIFDCNVEDFLSMLKTELELLDMEILSFNNKLKAADGILLESHSTTNFDVALSFAGEDRVIVEQIAEDLKEHSISVFYDKFEKEELWGKNLNDYFKSTYAENTRFVIPFISEHYPNKDWTNFEFTIAHAEAEIRDSEFILPVRIDDTPVMGIPDSVAYLDYNIEGKDGIVKAIISKLEIQ